MCAEWQISGQKASTQSMKQRTPALMGWAVYWSGCQILNSLCDWVLGTDSRQWEAKPGSIQETGSSRRRNYPCRNPVCSDTLILHRVWSRWGSEAFQEPEGWGWTKEQEVKKGKTGHWWLYKPGSGAKWNICRAYSLKVKFTSSSFQHCPSSSVLFCSVLLSADGGVVGGPVIIRWGGDWQWRLCL